MAAKPTGPLTIRKVENDADYKVFFEFPWTTYKDDPNWTPPLISTRKAVLDKKLNPGWEYMTGDYFVAYRGTQPVGTIAALINHHSNDYWKENVGWFGCFECDDDQEAATLLLKTAADHVKSLGATDGLRGPANLSAYDEWGLLIENFSPAVLLMPYNHDYYQRLVEDSGLGFAKRMDFFSYFINPQTIEQDGGMTPKLRRVAEKGMERNHVSVRDPRPKKLQAEVDLVCSLWDSAWSANWGFYPLTPREITKLFKDLKDFLDYDLIRFGQVNGQDVGFVMALPDFNQALRKAYPRPNEPEIITLLKILWYWKARRVITGQRILLMGVKPEYRGKGVEAAMNFAFFDHSMKTLKYPNTDCGWVLESNDEMNKLAKTFGLHLYKRYRVYQKPL